MSMRARRRHVNSFVVVLTAATAVGDVVTINDADADVAAAAELRGTAITITTTMAAVYTSLNWVTLSLRLKISTPNATSHFIDKMINRFD